MRAEQFVPLALKGTVNVDEALKRYDASINWISQHNNAMIGNGPFYIDSYNAAGGVITIKAFRDSSYPYNVGYWSKYEHPKLATIENVNEIPRIIHKGSPFNATIVVDMNGKPSSNATLNYFVSNGNGNVLLTGVAKPININSVGKFSINLSSRDTEKLSPGPNILKLFANSLEAYKPYIITKTVIVTRKDNLVK